MEQTAYPHTYCLKLKTNLPNQLYVAFYVYTERFVVGILNPSLQGGLFTSERLWKSAFPMDQVNFEVASCSMLHRPRVPFRSLSFQYAASLVTSGFPQRPMKANTISRRYQKRLSTALQQIDTGVSYREASKASRIPIATLHRAVQKNKTPATRRPGRSFSLTTQEEGLLVSLLTRYSDRGVALNRNHLCEAVAVIVSRMPPARREKLPFKDGKPGIKFLRGFQKRHGDRIKFTRPTRQEAVRFAACNGDTLTTHLATMEKLISDNAIDDIRLWNLDESGATPGKDVDGRSACKRLMRRDGIKDLKVPQFLNTHRVTMMASISAAGNSGPPLFVFKGKKLPFRRVVRGGEEVYESLADVLPRHSVISAREKCGGVDMHNFLNWGLEFVKSVKDLTANNRKLLLTYDAYRSHITLDVLELFHENNIIVYALPAHTSGKTQPLDVVMFSPFKKALNESISLCSTVGKIDIFDVFDFCRMLSYAYRKAFTEANIVQAFKKSGLWPIDSSQLLGVPRPGTAEDIRTILNVDQLEKLFEQKRAAVRETVLGSDSAMLANGYIDTTKGAVLTSDRALMLIREKVARDRAVYLAAEVESERKAVRAARLLEKQKTEAERMRALAWERRAKLCRMPVDVFKCNVRSIKQRRADRRLVVKRAREAKAQSAAVVGSFAAARVGNSSES